MKTIFKIFVLFLCVNIYAQTTVKGNVSDVNGQPLIGANVIVIGTTSGAVTDFDGNYTLKVDLNPPFSLKVTSVGFADTTLEVTANNQTLNFILKEGNELDEIVISASRTPERIFESPVTVERFGLKEIRNTASADFYDGLENLKGVDINTNSLTFKAINTRGFATFSNTRFMQLVDGMDNSAPALNFPLGNLLGMIETDIQSVELLPGAASALYGANAFNGILFMRSKNAFDHTGISGYYKQGITSQDASGDNTYTDFGIRAAHKFSDKFAAKVNFGYLKGTDWAATNYDGKPGTGATRDALNYNGYNVYGDLVKTNIRAAAGGLGIVPNVEVSRYGYNESDLTDYKAESIKADWGLYYRPWGTDFEVQYIGKYGTGNTIYQGTNRYNIDGFNMQQHKLEIKNDNFFLRGYMTVDDAGDSYDMVFTGVNILNKWKPHTQYFAEYIGTYVGATFMGASETQAHAAARAQAESGRYEPGTPEFDAALKTVTNDPSLLTGAKFQDNSKIYHADANYNFSHLIDVAEIQIGGSYRQYELNSFGTIYTDADGPIKYKEFGIYTQIQKKLMDDRLKFTGSIRYDKSIDLYDGFLSPRISVGYTAGDSGNHNIRGSFQTGFRNPTTQDLYIGLDSGGGVLVGSAPNNLERYSKSYDITASGQLLGVPASVTQDGRAPYQNSYSAASVAAFAATGDPSQLKAGNPSLVKPEKVTSFEVGYRGKLDRTTVDLSIYYNQYEDFLANEAVLSPLYGIVDGELDPTTGDIINSDGIVDNDPLTFAAIANGDYIGYQTYTNSDVPVNSFGGSIGINTKVLGNYDLGANYTYTKEDFDTDKFPDFRTNFNTPEHKVKASFGNTDVFKNFGFGVAWRWSDNYFWQAAFGDGNIPAYHTIDAQINLRVPSLKSTFKAGATNVLGDEYFSAIGTGFIGSQYYISWTINNL